MSETGDRDIADLLYQNGAGVPVLTCIAGVFMVAVVPSVRAHSPLALGLWLGALFIVAALRALDSAQSKARRRNADWNGRAQIARFGTGVVATAVAWAAFPVLFFGQLNPIERATMAIVLCALTGGSSAILSAAPRIAIAFGAGMLLPAAVMFLLTPGGDNMVLGVGGVLYFGFVILSTGIAHRGTMSAISVTRANQRLMRESERANSELTIAQSALHESLETLEERIKARTADLEHEMRERERYGVELARLAMHDPLTGLYNRSTLAQKLLEQLAVAHSAGESIAVLFLDLDKFKDVNDVHGHHAGDQVLREIVRRMSASVPREAILARWGGDEFVLAHRLSDGTDTAASLGEQLRYSISAPIAVGAETVSVGATIGIAAYPADGQTADELIRAADMAMYTAKQDGRGRIQTFNVSIATRLGRRHQLEQSLREAIAGKALRLHYQPVVDAATRRCTSLEALLRWDAPGFGSVTPSEFIPIAERTGEIHPIGRWVLDEACLTAASWPGAFPPPVSVNVSVAQIASGTLLEDVRGALVRSGLRPDRLQIEVTETLFASEHDLTIPTLRALRAMGIRILLDDFGTGFSSLSYLGSLPIDTLKIDKSFIDDLAGPSRAIVMAIQSLAGAFDLAIIAEGVETAEQAALLISMGVPALQGYYFSRPVPAESVREVIATLAGAVS